MVLSPHVRLASTAYALEHLPCEAGEDDIAHARRAIDGVLEILETAEDLDSPRLWARIRSTVLEKLQGMPPPQRRELISTVASATVVAVKHSQSGRHPRL